MIPSVFPACAAAAPAGPGTLSQGNGYEAVEGALAQVGALQTEGSESGTIPTDLSTLVGSELSPVELPELATDSFTDEQVQTDLVVDIFPDSALNPQDAQPVQPGLDQPVPGFCLITGAIPVDPLNLQGAHNAEALLDDQSPLDAAMEPRDRFGRPPVEWSGSVSQSARGRMQPGDALVGSGNASGLPAVWREWLGSMNRLAQPSDQPTATAPMAKPGTGMPFMNGAWEDAPATGSEILRLFLALTQPQADGTQPQADGTLPQADGTLPPSAGSLRAGSGKLADWFDLIGLGDLVVPAGPARPNGLPAPETLDAAMPSEAMSEGLAALETLASAMPPNASGMPRSALTRTLGAIKGLIPGEMRSEAPGSGRKGDAAAERDLSAGSAESRISAPQTPSDGMVAATLETVTATAAGPAPLASHPTAPTDEESLLPVQRAESETTATVPARRSSASVAEQPAPGPSVNVMRHLPEFAANFAAHQPDQQKPEMVRPNAAPEAAGEARTNPMERAIAGQVARSLSGAKAGSDTVIVVRLTPPELGTVRIEIRSDRDGLNARLHAEDPAVRESLERLLPTLRGDLRISDSRLTEISVAPQQNQHDPQQERSDPDARGRGQDPRDPQRDPHRRRQAQRFRNALDLVGSAADE